MKSVAISIGSQIVELERQLDRLFAARTLTEDVLRSRIGEISQLHGELRAEHLRAHLLVSEILTEAQRIKYDSLRGYGRHR